jgi:uncharacterized protein (TIGR02594 family)
MSISGLVSPNHSLKFGNSGPAVTAAQLAMKGMGYQLGGSGWFGPATDVAVRAIQRRAGIKVDGELGPATAKIIDDAVAHLTGAQPKPDAHTDAAPKVEIDRPLWLEAGIALIGTKEKPGAGDNQAIIDWAHEEGGDIAKEYTHDSIPWCFEGSTSVMTARGFVRLDQIEDGEPVYQVDDAGNLSLTPSVRIEKEYEGDLFDINHASIRLSCDVGHRWFGAWGSRDSWPKFKTLEALNTAGLTIPAVIGNSAMGVDLSDTELQLLAAFISDGKNRKANGKGWSIDFEVSKRRKIAALMALCPAHIYVQKKAYGPLTKVPLTVLRFTLPEFFSVVFDEYKVLSHAFVNRLSIEQCRTFLQAYATFDGNGKETVYTSSEPMRNNLVQMAVMAGYMPSVTVRKSMLSDRPSWTIKLGTTKTSRRIEPHQVSRRYFKGKLYCVNVPEGRIIVAGENHTPILTGNCALFANHCLTKVGLPGTETLWALDFAGNWPAIKLIGPAVGAFAPMVRSGGGHIIQIVGKDARGNIMGLGGNQSDSVSIVAFPMSRLNKGFWWPKSVPIPKKIGLGQLPIVSSSGKFSTKES